MGQETAASRKLKDSSWAEGAKQPRRRKEKGRRKKAKGTTD